MAYSKLEPFGKSPPNPKFQRAPLALRPLTVQGRAHRKKVMNGRLFIPDWRVWDGLTQASAVFWQRLRAGGAGGDWCGGTGAILIP